MRTAVSILLFFFIPYQSFCQILPKEGGKLSYTIIGFSFPQIREGDKCKLEIAMGCFNNSDSFNENIIKSIDCETSKKIARVPAFGHNYTWCIVFPGKGLLKSDLHHFSTMISPYIDTAMYRLRIVNEAQQYKDAYVFLDCTHVLYDMQGNPVWFIPESSLATNENTNLRHAADIKLSPQGTITFITNDLLHEINYNGDILWKGPNTGAVSGDTSENYHHEFTKLFNGHYMVMGNETVAWKLPEYKADSVKDVNIEMDSAHVFHQKIQFGTIIEYDEKGRVVWYWRSSDYFKGSDLFNDKTANGRFKVEDVHENSFFFDEKVRVVYVSCRNISQVIKVKYPEGTVMAVYGKINQHDGADMANELFSGQHCVKVSQDGYLYLFNNNSSLADLPGIIMVEEPAAQAGNLKKVWEYKCTLDGMSDRERQAYINLMKRQQNDTASKKHHFTSGGSVTELPDRSIFASISTLCSKVFIVAKDKKIIWSAIPEEMDVNDKVWNLNDTYRASIIDNNNDLEKLVWNAEIKEQ